MEDKLEIELSKKKLLLFLIAGIIFVIIGYLGAAEPEDFISPLFRSPTVIRIAGIAGVSFFGIAVVFIVWKLFDNKPGLIIDQNGVTDNTNATSIGLIEWNDIVGIEVKEVMSTKFLILHTRNPDKYIKRAKNFFSKRAMKMNMRAYGSPLSITSNSLKINFEELEGLIGQALRNKN